MSTFRKFRFIGILLLGTVVYLQSCNKGEGPGPAFLWEQHYIAGTTTPTNAERPSPYILLLDDMGKGVLTTATSSYAGSYEVSADSLIFHTDDREKWLSFEFSKRKLGGAHYQVRFYNEDGSYEPAPVQYNATGVMDQIPEQNQLAGKIFAGSQYRFGTEGVYLEGYTYKFSGEGQHYGSGVDTVNDQTDTYELFGNVAFRYAEGNTKEFGVLIDGELVVFRQSGLFYWGTYNIT